MTMQLDLPCDFFLIFAIPVFEFSLNSNNLT